MRKLEIFVDPFRNVHLCREYIISLVKSQRDYKDIYLSAIMQNVKHASAHSDAAEC